jgi:protocatechuate 3,4-dioxygenase beta subunit
MLMTQIVNPPADVSSSSIMRRLAAAMGLVVPLAVAPPQTRATGFAVGRVLDAATNRPVAGAVVVLTPMPPSAGDPSPLPSPAGSSAVNVLTDDDGRFLFRGLTPGTYTLAARAPAYLDGGLGQRRSGGRLQPLVLASGQAVGDLVIRLWKEAVVSGAVTDQAGAPVPAVWVQAVRRNAPVRPGQLPSTRSYFWQGARTDDDGRYRIGGLEPGEYVVTVPSHLVQLPATTATADAAAQESLRTSGAPTVNVRTRAVQLGDSLLLTADDGEPQACHRLSGDVSSQRDGNLGRHHVDAEGGRRSDERRRAPPPDRHGECVGHGDGS